MVAFGAIDVDFDVLAALPEGVAPGADALLSAASVVEKAEFLWARYEWERDRLEHIDKWYKGEQPCHVVDHPGNEVKRLLELSRTPWMGLVVTTIAQAMFVDGFKSPKPGATVDGPWRTWLANGLHHRQTAIHRAALGYGYAYMLVEQGVGADGAPQSVMRGLSPKRCYAYYLDSSFDDWPLYAIRVDWLSGGRARVFVYDDTFAHELLYAPNERRERESAWVYQQSVYHAAGVVPVVRYANQLDLDGRTIGEVEPFIGVAARIDKSAFDLLLTQQYNSWKKLWIAGLTEPPANEEEARRQKLKLRQEDVLIAESSETKFGAIPETSLEGFIKAIDDNVEHLAAVSQLPGHLLSGKLINLSAEALSAARAPLTQKVYERQVGFGAAHDQALRLAAKLQGDSEAAMDIESHVTWQDMEVRSLAQAADALGKVAVQLGVPKQSLWRMIPGVTELDAAEWEQHLLDDDPVAVYLRELGTQTAAGGADDSGDPVTSPGDNKQADAPVTGDPGGDQ